MKFRSFANCFVIVLVLLALLPGAAVLAQDEPAATVIETITFETNTPAVTATDVPTTEEITAVPISTDVVVTPVVEPPAEPPAPEAPGISETALISIVQTLVWGIIALAAVIIVIIIAHGLLTGKSIKELAQSQPVHWGVTVAANAAAITPGTEDDEWIAARARQLGYQVVNDGGVITLKKVDIPPISLPVG